MVVDREREIRDFVPVEYWSLEAELAKTQVPVEKGRFVAALVERDGKKLELKTGLEAATVQTDLQGASWTVATVKEREQQRNPAPPFTTSTLQQEASRKLNFTAKRTMAVAQQLYEGVDIGARETSGLITYMRTDSVNVAETARAEAREYIAERLGKELLPPSARFYKTRSRMAQEAHEAIRPTSVFHEPAALKRHLTNDQFRLYELIWKRFLASQMASAVFDVTTVDVDAQANARPRYRFRATGSRLKFRGFLTLYLEGRDDEEVRDEDRQPLPVLAVGEVVDLIRLKPEQHFTQPPPRYTEATLVKALEERGIGRPSTYAPILSTIQDRGYVDRDGKKLKPTELGEQVNDLLVKQFATFLNLDFTATLEEKLDDIAQKELPWVPVVRDFYLPLNEDLKRAEVEVERIKPAEIPTDEVCSEGHPMVIKEGRFGKFMACSRYPEHKETRPVPEDLPPDAPEERCSHGVQMQLRTGRFGPYYASTHECGETKAYAARTGVACPSCGADLVEKRSRKGRVFFGCNTWPKCEWVSWYRPLPEPCSQCGGIQVEIGRDRRRCLKHEGEPARPAARSRAGEEADGPATRASARKDGAAKGGRRGGTAPAGVTKVVRAKRATSAAAAKNGRAGTRKRASRSAEPVR
jgi:DNA topoisomerase-1